MKKREHNKKNKTNKKEPKKMNEMYEMIKQFVETQIKVNKFRIKHFQEIEDCLDCKDDEEIVSAVEQAIFSKKFEEEWS